MRSLELTACGHCNAMAGAPCRSCGGRVCYSPHMKRLNAWRLDLAFDDPECLAALQRYREWALRWVFGRATPELLALFAKHGTIDPAAKWVRTELAKDPEPAPPAFLPLPALLEPNSGGQLAFL